MAEAIRDFGVTEDNELDVVGNDFVRVFGREATIQGSRIRVGIYRGEIIENQAIGVDWVARLGNKLTDPFVLREEIRERIASVPDVISVVGSQIVTDENRRGSVRFRFRDAFSTSSVDGETVI